MNDSRSLSQYSDQLYFGLLSQNPDTVIATFIHKYVPVIYKKYDSSGIWTAYPPGIFKEPPYITVTNSYVFEKHPCFDANFKSGELSITQKIYEDPQQYGKITDMKLWFEFSNKEDAKNAYKKLVDTFSSFNVLKRITSTNGVDKAEFTDKSFEKYYSSIQIMLAKDFFKPTRYVTINRSGQKLHDIPGYKILIEIGNDLY